MSTPFLDLSGFQNLWDGPPLTTSQQSITTLLLGVASNWIYTRLPAISPVDPAAQFVVYDVVSNAVRYQKYSKLSTFSEMTGHRSKAGTFDDPMKALEFTNVHKQLLGISLSAAPVGQFYEDDFADPTRSGWQGVWTGFSPQAPWSCP